ncbi:MAG: hypothetical protein K0R12_694 [Gammaproteobacteria bacterium]|jgi:hypothetical protein|nr:hypothetical protein [Gammaproteobacteria bacterium]
MILSSGNFHLQGRSVIEGYVTTYSGSTTLVNPFADALDDFLKNSSENSENLFQEDLFSVANNNELPVVLVNPKNLLSHEWLAEGIRYNIAVLPIAILLPLIISDQISTQSTLFSDSAFPALGLLESHSLSDLGLITGDTLDLGTQRDNDYTSLYVDDLFIPFSLDPLPNIDMMLLHGLNLSGILVL